VGETEREKARITEESNRNKEKDLEKGDKETEPRGQQPQRKSTSQREFDEKFLVTLKGRDQLNPHNWGVTYRWFLTGLVGLFVLNATFASSGPSQLTPSIIAHFGVSREVGVLTIALFVSGYCVGPLLWGPLSERYGRKLVFIVAFLPYTCFQVGCALAPNIGSLLVFRFLGGCFAASPLTNSGGVIADLWDADRRGIAMAIFSLAPFAGPAIAPIVSGALEVTGSSWRWIFWILCIFAGVCLGFIIVLLPETYVPYLLHKEAKKLRKETGDDRWHSANEHPDHKVTLKETLDHTILKPFIMIFQEPMLLVLTLYLSFVYGIVYLLFEAIPIIFQEYHGWNAVEGGLAFLALPIGGAIAVVLYGLTFNRTYMKKHHALKGKMVPPEERLKPLMLAAPAFAISFFWVGWTYYPSINPVSPLLAVTLMGFAILYMFLSIFNYLIDTYLASAASALAINTVCRSAFGAGFPLFATQMYIKLGVPGASSLLGGLAILFLPAPFILYKYGKKIREMSKNAMVLD
jgi:multidrug resistance protein